MSFKSEVLTGIHALGPGTGVPARSAGVADVVKCALYLASGSLSPSATTAYSATSEVGNSGSYAAGGATVTQANAPVVFGTTGTWNPTASISFTTFTATAFDTALFYNSSQGNKAIELCNFSSQSIVAGTFTLTMPTPGAATSLLQLA